MPAEAPMFIQSFAPAPRIVELPLSYVDGVRISVLRLDEIDPMVSGNKWFKLRFYLEKAIRNNQQIVTFGGAWSNHILATAIACQRAGITCTGIIRGEKPALLSTTLLNAAAAGMELLYLSREEYRRKTIPDLFNDASFLIIPEGGGGTDGIKGAATIFSGIDATRFSHCFCAVGTGTTLAGLISSPLRPHFITGIPVLKNASATEEIQSMLDKPSDNWELIHGYEFGGYAKHNAELISFMNEFYRITSIPSDFVYTAKMFYASTSLLRNGYAAPGSNVLLIHTGGLQGNAGLPPHTLTF